MSACLGLIILRPPFFRYKHTTSHTTLALALLSLLAQKKFLTFEVVFWTPQRVPPHMDKKYTVADMRIPLQTTALSMLLILFLTQYFSFCSIFSTKKESTCMDLRDKPKGVPNNLDTSSSFAHCHMNLLVQFGLSRLLRDHQYRVVTRTFSDGRTDGRTIG
jgi:hypothetical protein